jgi:hypothetical protein
MSNIGFLSRRAFGAGAAMGLLAGIGPARAQAPLAAAAR